MHFFMFMLAIFALSLYSFTRFIRFKSEFRAIQKKLTYEWEPSLISDLKEMRKEIKKNICMAGFQSGVGTFSVIVLAYSYLMHAG